jgi:hypothetical protein
MSDHPSIPSADPKPTFATNSDTERVADALNGLLEHRLNLWNRPFELAIATGYFNPDGFNLIAEALERIGTVRLLLGAEPTAPERALRPLDPDVPPQRAERAKLRRALQGHVREIEQDRDLLGFSVDTDQRAMRLVQWLQSGRVQVRRLEQRFLHGKAFLITTDSDAVLAGSSNFTYAGLARNAELNLGHYDPHVVQQVAAWFEKQWDDATPFDLAAIYEARYEHHNPYVIYLRMLLERYGQELEEETAARKLSAIQLTEFQEDGVWRASRILENHGGVLIADGVGLGKSFIGGEIMRRIADENRQRVLLISPAALRDGPWRSFLEDYGVSRRVHSVSYEELSQDPRLNEEATGPAVPLDLDDVSLVVIDEAHAYRNPDTIRAQVLRKLLGGTPRKRLVLLTATPVNNTLWDLYYLLAYFIQNDAEFADQGILSLRKRFAEAMAQDPEDLSADRLFDILDAVSVRRTRRFVRRYYPNATVTVGGLQIPIRFPTPRVFEVTYDLDETLPGFFQRFAHALSFDLGKGKSDSNGKAKDTVAPPEGHQLTLARYAPSRYLLGGTPESRELQLAGLLRSGLLKRFESSAYAFARTCRKMADSHDAFLRALDRGVIATGKALDEWLHTDTDDQDAFWQPDHRSMIREGEEFAALYDVERLRTDVVKDRDLLLGFADEADRIRNENDPKLDALVKTLEEIAEDAETEAVGEENVRDHRKVILFTYFADTVEWIHRRIEHEVQTNPKLSCYRGRIATISGQEGDKREVLFGFAPKSSRAPAGSDQDRYDLLISTDVLAEGVNLQQARHIINADLPWNPMRLVQRHGRIDRIGSQYDEVFLHCFFPDRQLDTLLGLEERLHRKIAQAAASVGVESEVIPGSRIHEVSFSETREEIERLRQRDATLFETGGETGGVLSGEHYRQELREGLATHADEEAVRGLPWGSGSGMEVDGEPGFVFCVRVADHGKAQFRRVTFDRLGAAEVTGDTLSCLASAHATPDTPRVLPDEMHRLAYQAWEVAKQDILAEWLKATDPRNLLPAVPKVMRESAEILREHPPVGHDQTQLKDALDTLETAYPARIQNMFRTAIRSSEVPVEQGEAILETIRELGLTSPTPPEPLPVIDEDDIHLVCWLALTPRAPLGGSEWAAPDQLSFVPEEQLSHG